MRFIKGPLHNIVFPLITIFILHCSKKGTVITITNPTDGEIVGGIVNINVRVTDGEEVLTVGFFIDDSLEFFTQSEPFVYHWNTTHLSDSTIISIYLKATLTNGEYAYSETIYVTIYNPVILDESFESYPTGSYPTESWYEIWRGESGYVDTQYAYRGEKSFKLCGTSQWVRTDGVKINLTRVHHITYECALFIPEDSPTGAIFGFYYQINPTLGTIYNGVLFDYEDNLVYVRGIEPSETGYSWFRNTWYIVKVRIDYDLRTMDVWINNEQVMDNIIPAAREISDVFALSTEYGAGGSIYYDDVKIYK